MMLKTKIDSTERKDIQQIIDLVDYLLFPLLGPKAALDLAINAEYILNNEFCPHCRFHYDGCECLKEISRDWDDTI